MYLLKYLSSNCIQCYRSFIWSSIHSFIHSIHPHTQHNIIVRLLLCALLLTLFMNGILLLFNFSSNACFMSVKQLSLFPLFSHFTIDVVFYCYTRSCTIFNFNIYYLWIENYIWMLTTKKTTTKNNRKRSKMKHLERIKDFNRIINVGSEFNFILKRWSCCSLFSIYTHHALSTGHRSTVQYKCI